MIRLAVRCCARAGRAGPRRADRAGARTGSRRSAARATSSTRSTAARASCRSWARSRRRPATAWSRSISTEVPDDWADRWQDFHKPLLVGERLWLRPSWEEPREGAIDLVVDPGRAFGTGAHPTTRLCLELCSSWPTAGEADGPLTDLGTGSGVLAIAAAKLGWDPVARLRPRAGAIEAAAANAAANGVEVDLRARQPAREPARRSRRPSVANLTAPVLRERLARRRDRGGSPSLPAVAPRALPVPTLVCSGLLPAELDEVAAAFAAAGLRRGATAASTATGPPCCSVCAAERR